MPHGFFRTHGFLPCRTLMFSLGSIYLWEYKAPLTKNDEVMQHKFLEFRFTFTFCGYFSFGVSGNTLNFSTCSSFSIKPTNLKEYADRDTLQGCPSHRRNHLVSISRNYRISSFRLGERNNVDWIRCISESFVRKKYQLKQVFPIFSFYPLTLLD